MYCIITDNEKLVKCAKRFGEEVVEVEKSVTIQNKEKKEYYNITDCVVDNFLKAFLGIEMGSTGTQALKYILKHNLGCNKNLYEEVFPKLAKKFKTTQNKILYGITHQYSNCITNMPEKYKQFFYDYECYVHMRAVYVYDFIKACQEYIHENYESLSVIGDSSAKIDEFLEAFTSLNKKTLGYRCAKYILQNNIECNLDTKENVYKQLATSFDTVPSGVANGITNVFTSVMRNYKHAPKDFIGFYKKHTKDKLTSVGERSIEFIQIMQKYLEEN